MTLSAEEVARLRVVVGLSPTRPPSLTRRQREVLELLAEGLSRTEIGARLAVSPLTAKKHIDLACRRLDARTRAHAVAIAIRSGLISAGGDGDG